jgi:hypothetical protein
LPSLPPSVEVPTPAPPALPPPRVLPAYGGEAFVDDVCDDLFDPPPPSEPTPGRLLNLLDGLPGRMAGDDRADTATGPSRRSSFLFLLTFALTCLVLTGLVLRAWLR